jgi:hypothetical protein
MRTPSARLPPPAPCPRPAPAAWQYLHVARTAVRVIESTEWWRATGASLRLEVLPSKDAYTAWQSSVAYALGPAPTCVSAPDPATGKPAPCRVFRAGIVGPWELEGTQLVQLVTRMANMTHVAYGATDDSLTPSPTLPAPPPSMWQPFLRATHTDAMAVGALLSFIRSAGWRIFTIVHAREPHSDDQAVALATLAQRYAGAWGAAAGERQA